MVQYTIDDGGEKCEIIGHKSTPVNPDEMNMIEYFNLRTLDLDEFCQLNGSYDYDSCNNCLHSDIRISTGCHWCLHRGCVPVGIDEVCDLHSKDTTTNRIIWELAYWHWVEWDKRWFERISQKGD